MPQPTGISAAALDNADVGKPLVDEVGDTDARWQLILERLDAGDDLALRARWPVGHPCEQVLCDRRDIGWQ
jgi:hypothetical protein